MTIVPFKQVPNLQIWNLKTGELNHSFTQCSYSRDVDFNRCCNCRCGHISNGTPRRIMRSTMLVIRYNFACVTTKILCLDGHDLTKVLQEIDSSTTNGDIPIDSSSIASLSPSATRPAVHVMSCCHRSSSHSPLLDPASAVKSPSSRRRRQVTHRDGCSRRPTACSSTRWRNSFGVVKATIVRFISAATSTPYN